MFKDPKSIGDMAFNVAITASFVVPEIGPAASAGLAGMQFAFDLFFPTAPPKKEDMIPTIAWTAAMMQGQTKSILIGTQKLVATADCANRVVDVLTANQELAARWEDLYDPPDESDKVNYDNWKNRMNDYFAGKTADFSKLPSTQLWFETQPGVAGKSFESYALLGSVTITHHKLGVLWDYNRELKKYADDLDSRQKYASAYKIWKGTNPQTRGPEPTEVPDPKPVDRDHFLFNNLHAKDLRRDVKALTTGANALLQIVRDERQNQIDQRRAKVVLKTDGSKYWYLDTQTGEKSTPVTDQDFAQDQMDTYQGTLEAAVWDEVTLKYSLDDVADDRVQQFADTIATWSTAESSVPALLDRGLKPGAKN